MENIFKEIKDIRTKRKIQKLKNTMTKMKKVPLDRLKSQMNLIEEIASDLED